MSDKNTHPVPATQSFEYFGPLPPSSEFARYEQVLPGTAERILATTEKEAQHRHTIEDKLITISGRSQIFALIVSILSLGVVGLSIYFNQPIASIGVVGLSIYFNQPIASIAPAIIAITGLASIFINRNK